MTGKSRRYVLLDRDGTIIRDQHYASDPDSLEFLPGAIDGLISMQTSGLGLVIISNQSGVARGKFSPGQLARFNERLVELLDDRGITVAGIYCCPHGPDDNCDCRKPLPGLVHKAAAEIGFDPAECFMIGDKGTDIELGRELGAVTFLIGPSDQVGRPVPDHTVTDLSEAAAIIRSMLSKDRIT